MRLRKAINIRNPFHQFNFIFQKKITINKVDL